MAMRKLGDPHPCDKDPCVDDVPDLPDDLLPRICQHSPATCRRLSKAWRAAFDTHAREHGVRIACVGVRHREPHMRPLQPKLDVTLTLKLHELSPELARRGSKYFLKRRTSVNVNFTRQAPGVTDHEPVANAVFSFNANSIECPGRSGDFDAFHLKSSKVGLQPEGDAISGRFELQRYGNCLRIIAHNTNLAQRGYGHLYEYYMLADHDDVYGQEDEGHARSLSLHFQGALRFMEMILPL